MSTNFVEVLGHKAHEMGNDVQSMDLEFQKLRRCPSSDDGVALGRLGVEIQQKGTKEALLHHDVVGFDVALVVADREDLGPEKFLELKVLISHIENGLTLLAVDLVKDGVGDHLLKDALITVLLEEELVTLRARDHVVDQYTDLVTEALVILLVASSKDHFEGSLERGNDLWVDSELANGFFAANLDQIPKSFDGEGDNIRAEVLRLADNANEVSTDTLNDDHVSNGLEQTDGCNGLQNRDHGVN